jgi:transposase InsO family protein
VVQVQQTLQVSERRACRVLKHCRATHQYVVQQPDDEAPLRTRIIELARAYGRYGYRRITALLHREGWAVNHKRVERIWRQEGLKVPQKQASAPLVGGRFLHSETAGVSAPCLVL